MYSQYFLTNFFTLFGLELVDAIVSKCALSKSSSDDFLDEVPDPVLPFVLEKLSFALPERLPPNGLYDGLPLNEELYAEPMELVEAFFKC
jgi:hypothetical protein